MKGNKIIFNFLIVAAVIGVFCLINIKTTKAVSILLPFGGKISTILPNVGCLSGTNAFTIIPALPVFPPGNYGLTPKARIKNPTAKITPGTWIIGLYEPIPSTETCWTMTTPPLPFPVLPVVLIGTS